MSIEREILDKRLLEIIKAAKLSSILEAACLYAVFPGGKRARAMLTLETHRVLLAAAQNISPSVVTWAAALELLHCASLVHDDLPGLDNDDYRRGNLSCHKKFGIGTAVLAGDALVTIALGAVADDSHPRSRIALSILSSAYTLVCDGQQRDISQLKTEIELFEMYSRKTGALFGAAVSLAVLDNANDDRIIPAAFGVGKTLGIIFQLKDDALDSEPERKGREKGSDEKNNKVTLFSVAPNLVEGLEKQLSSKVRELEKILNQKQESLTLLETAV